MLLLDQMTNSGIQMSFVDRDDQLIGFIAWPRCIQMNIRGPDIGTAEINIFRCVVMRKLYMKRNVCTNSLSHPIFDGNNKVIADDADKAESFNNVFVEKSRIDGINRELPNVIIPTDIPVLENIDITEQDVAGQLSSLNISKSYGPDGLGPRLLKELKPVIVELSFRSHLLIWVRSKPCG